MSVYRIPLVPSVAQTFVTGFASGSYKLRFYYCVSPEAGWILDILNGLDDTPVACGLPLVTGTNLLGPYAHLGFVESLYVVSDDPPDAVPAFDTLGTTSNLFVEIDDGG